MKDNGFKLVKEKRRYPAQPITDADYVDDIALQANTPAQAKTLLHSLEREAAGIGLYVNADKTECMRFNHVTRESGRSVLAAPHDDDKCRVKAILRIIVIYDGMYVRNTVNIVY